MDFKEKVIKLLKSKELSKEEKEKLANIFPELKESEDEKIRTELIGMVKEDWPGRRDILAWLEKQKPSKAFIVEKDKWYVCVKNFEMSDGSCAYIQGHLYKGDDRGCLQNEQGCWFGFWENSGEKYFRLATNKELIKKQGEQKPVGWSEEDKEMIDSIINAIDVNIAASDYHEIESWLKDLKERGLPQPKQEWDEEDERMCCLIISHFESHKLNHEYITTDDKVIKWIKSLKKSRTKQGCCECDEIDIQAAIEICENAGYDLIANRLKSIKTEVQPQQEWSEEDEIALADALWCCKQAASIAKDENDMGNIWFAENWLKSLKERCTWKPSEEQMEALDSATENCAYSEYQDCLKELIEQLKKLREG